MKRLIDFRKPIMALLVIAMTLSLAFTSLAFTAAPALAAERTAKITFVHAINGVKINLSRELPVDIQIFRNGKLHHTIMDFKLHQRVTMELPAGTYRFVVINHMTGKILATKTSVIKGGAAARVRAELNAKKVPVLNVKIK